MTLQEMNERYYLHDSCIDKIEYDQSSKELLVQMDFCYWAQAEYNDAEPENGDVKIIFHDVNVYDGLVGDIDHFSVLDAECNDDGFYFSILDDFHDEQYELVIRAASVDFVPVNTPSGA
jgi:hypothetical protein